MERKSENKIVLIRRKTRVEELIARYNTVEQAKFYVESLGADFSDYIEEDRIYNSAVREAVSILTMLGRVQILSREYISNFIFGKEDLVVAIGQDGVVANSLKYLTNNLLIGVNPDPKRWDGVLLPFQVRDLPNVVKDVFNNRRKIKEVTMAKAELNDGQVIYGVNDLFIGQKTHVSARYRVHYDEMQENHSSSGIIVSTGLGSTGWMKSIITGAAGIAANSAGVQKGSLFKPREWSVEELLFSVREPFPSRTSQCEIVFGKIDRERELKIVSQMPENGVIFSDGIESDFLEFNSGVEAVIKVAEKKGMLVI